MSRARRAPFAAVDCQEADSATTVRQPTPPKYPSPTPLAASVSFRARHSTSAQSFILASSEHSATSRPCDMQDPIEQRQQPRVMVTVTRVLRFSRQCATRADITAAAVFSSDSPSARPAPTPGNGCTSHAPATDAGVAPATARHGSPAPGHSRPGSCATASANPRLRSACSTCRCWPGTDGANSVMFCNTEALNNVLLTLQEEQPLRGGACQYAPIQRQRPCCGVSRQASTFNNVLLPAPEPPQMAIHSPFQRQRQITQHRLAGVVSEGHPDTPTARQNGSRLRPQAGARTDTAGNRSRARSSMTCSWFSAERRKRSCCCTR